MFSAKSSLSSEDLEELLPPFLGIDNKIMQQNCEKQYLHIGAFAFAYQLGIVIDTHDMIAVVSRVEAI